MPTDSSHTARDLILDFERECTPFQYRLNGVCLWPLFRFAVWEHLNIAIEGLSARQHPRGSRGMIGRIDSFAGMVGELTSISRITRRHFDVIAMSTTNRLRDRSGSGFRNVYLDYIDPPVDNSLTVYVDPRGQRTPITPNTLFMSTRSIWPQIRFSKRYRTTGLTELSNLRSLLDGFLNSRGCDLLSFDNDKFRDEFWNRTLTEFLARRDSFRTLFRRTRPRLVIIDCYYDKMWAVAAAHDIGLPVVELQHGILYNGHMAYTFDEDVLAPHRDGIIAADHFFSFGRYFTEILTGKSLWASADIISTGFPKIETYSTRFVTKSFKVGQPLRVLISSQWILAEKLASFLRAAMPALSGNIEVTVKPHPLERDVSRFEQIPGITVQEPGTDFYETVIDHDVHCSVFSTTLFESMGIGVPTMILGLPGSENAMRLTEKGFCKVARSTEEFAVLLNSATQDQGVWHEWKQRTAENIDYFWEPDASANIHRALAAIIASPQ